MENQNRVINRRELKDRRGVRKYKSLVISFLMLIFAAGLTMGSAQVAEAALPDGFQYFNNKGKNVCAYYQKGKKISNRWLKLNGKLYYFDSNGFQVTGWQNGTISTVRRYFYPTLGPKGFMATGFVTDSSGNVRYFNPSTGVMARGFVTIDGGTRYFDTNTGVLYTGRRKIGKYFYFFQGHGNAAKRGIVFKGGWKTVGTSKCYYNTKDGHAHIGWVTLSGKKYYFDKNGYLLMNKTFRIGDKTYIADKDGVVTESSSTPSSSTPEIDPTYTEHKTFQYTASGSGCRVYDAKNARYYNMVPEFATDYGVTNGTMTDRDILAALCECEAGDQGLIGMEAVAMCVLNRTIKADKEFPSEVRLVIYQTGPRQYDPTISALNRRLRGSWNNKTLAYQAADEAMRIFTAYRTKGTPRIINGFYYNQDHNFMYFMMSSVFSPSYSRGGFSYVYSGHTFFIDWSI